MHTGQLANILHGHVRRLARTMERSPSLNVSVPHLSYHGRLWTSDQSTHRLFTARRHRAAAICIQIEQMNRGHCALYTSSDVQRPTYCATHHCIFRVCRSSLGPSRNIQSVSWQTLLLPTSTRSPEGRGSRTWCRWTSRTPGSRRWRWRTAAALTEPEELKRNHICTFNTFPWLFLYRWSQMLACVMPGLDSLSSNIQTPTLLVSSPVSLL